MLWNWWIFHCQAARIIKGQGHLISLDITGCFMYQHVLITPKILLPLLQSYFVTDRLPSAEFPHVSIPLRRNPEPNKNNKKGSRESPGFPQLPGLPVGGTWTLQGLGTRRLPGQQRMVFCSFFGCCCWRFMEKDLGMDIYFISFKCLSNDMGVLCKTQSLHARCIWMK